MKSSCLFLFFIFSTKLLCQVGIGTTTPNATLDIPASNMTTPTSEDGILIPRVDEFPVSNPTALQDGMMVFITGNGAPSKGFYYWDHTGSAWVTITREEDADWYLGSSSSSPNSINDNVFTMGQVGIGKNNPSYSLDIEAENANYDRILNLYGITDTNAGSTYNLVSEMVYNGSSSGQGRGFWNNISGTGDGDIVGTINGITNEGDGEHIGTENRLSGSGAGTHYGVYNQMMANGDGYINGIRTVISGSGIGTQTGLFNWLDVDGSNNQWGAYNYLSGGGTGARRGTENILQNSSTGNQYATSNTVNNSGSANAYGTYNLLGSTSSGTQNGTFNYITNSGNNQHIGSRSLLSGTGSGTHYGTFNTLNGSGNGLRYGLRNEISSSGNGNRYGVYNLFSGTNTAIIYGTFSEISSQAAGPQYGTYSLLNGTGTGAKYGNYSEIIANTGFGANYGAYQSVSGSSNSDKYGIYNEMASSSGNFLYGTYNNMSSNGVLYTYGSLNNLISNGNSDFLIGQANELFGSNASIITGTTNTIGGNATMLVGSENIITGGVGVGAITGVNNYIENTTASMGTVKGIQNDVRVNAQTTYGIYNEIDIDNSNNTYGIYTELTAYNTGEQYALYAKAYPNPVSGYDTRAAIFEGSVGIREWGLSDTYYFPDSPGPNGYIMELVGDQLTWVQKPVPNPTYWSYSSGAYHLATPGSDITFLNDQTTITFAASIGTPAPMLQMFDSGSVNAQKMVIAHSPAYANWGLAYADVDDAFIFEAGGTNKVEIDLTGSPILTVHGVTQSEEISVGIAVPTHDITIKQSGSAEGSTGGLGLISPFSTDHWKVYHSGSHLSFAENGVRRAYVEAGTGNYMITSDRRLKKNIEPLMPILDKINQLQAYSYHYKDQDASQKKVTGFMAQDVQKIFPEAVTETEEGFLSINYDLFGVLAIKSIQEQQKEIKALQEKVNQQEIEINKIKALAKRIQMLETNLE